MADLTTLAGVAQWLQNEADVVARIRPCASKRYRQMASTCEAAQREIEELRSKLDAESRAAARFEQRLNHGCR